MASHNLTEVLDICNNEGYDENKNILLDPNSEALCSLI